MLPKVWLALACVCFILLWLILRLRVFRREHVKNLENKAVLITGSTGDFGSQLAKRLDALGITVYAGARSPEGAAATRLKEACSSRLQLLKLDVTRDDHIAEAVETVKATLGDKRLWAVVNNAGVALYGGFEWIPMEKVKNVMDTNVLGTMRITTAFLPLMKASHGRVVIISSILGHHRLPGTAIYSTTKSALVGFAEVIRRELKSWSVSVHIICPYLYRTNMSNPDTLLKEMEINWETGNDSKCSYPSTYLTDFKKRLAVYLATGKSEESVREVIDDMEDAVIGVRPKVSYHPGLVPKILHYALKLSPTGVLDFLLFLIEPPTHEGERNRVLDFLYYIFWDKIKSA